MSLLTKGWDDLWEGSDIEMDGSIGACPSSLDDLKDGGDKMKILLMRIMNIMAEPEEKGGQKFLYQALGKHNKIRDLLKGKSS